MSRHVNHAHNRTHVGRYPKSPRLCPRRCVSPHWRAECRGCGWYADKDSQHAAFVAAIRHADGCAR